MPYNYENLLDYLLQEYKDPVKAKQEADRMIAEDEKERKVS